MKRIKFLTIMLAMTASIGFLASCGDDVPSPDDNGNTSSGGSGSSGTTSNWSQVAGTYLTAASVTDLCLTDRDLTWMLASGDNNWNSAKSHAVQWLSGIRITSGGEITELGYEFSDKYQSGSLCSCTFFGHTICYYKVYEKKMSGTFTFKNETIYKDGTPYLKVDTSNPYVKRLQSGIKKESEGTYPPKLFILGFTCYRDLRPVDNNALYYSQVAK